jgi:hypothetical protein
MVEGSTPAGWYADPTGQGDGRYWNGTAWTESVNRGGVTVNVPIDPGKAQQPPFPGTQVHKALTMPAMPISRPISPPVTVTAAPASHSPIAAIMGVLAIIFFVILMIVAVSGSSSEDSPETEPTVQPEEPAPPVEPEAPAEGD